MTWMTKLYETYQQGLHLDLPEDEKLMPISHAEQNAHINIVIDGEGNFKRATVLEKTKIVLPATEQSAGRTSGDAPHPLADKLQYVAKDYLCYGGQKKSYFDSYQTLLWEWCQSEYHHPKAQSVYNYISKGNVIKDLIDAHTVYVDHNQTLLTTWPHEKAGENSVPLLLKILPKEKACFDQGNALVCWSVEAASNLNPDTWTDASLQESWVAFDTSTKSNKGLCYADGSQSLLATSHPARIRHTGDKAKLISSNDANGFTYRGKFDSDTEALGISFQVTQKAHNALRWLISRQGYRNGDQRIVAWAVSGKPIPTPLMDSYSFFDGDLDVIESEEDNPEKLGLNHAADLGQSFALRLNKKMAGYRSKLDDHESIVIMGIHSATPGRMGITYYRERMAKEFIDLLERWYLDFAWQQRYSKPVLQSNNKKPKFITTWPISAPVPSEIAKAAYGELVKDSLRKNLYERLIPCILEGRPLPLDILKSCIHNAINPYACNPWEQERNIAVTCALYRGFYRRHPTQSERRDYSMSLEFNNTSRDYLYGRLLAIAERIEKMALSVANEKRMTTAERLMQRFADRPYSTWEVIELALRPYIQKLNHFRKGFITNRLKEIDEIMSLFENDEFKNDKKLSGEFLLGYHCQRQASRVISTLTSKEEV